MKKQLLGLIFLAALMFISVTAQSEEMGNLTINVTGFQNDNGFAMIALFNSEDGFAGKIKAFRELKIQIKNKMVSCEFKDIPKGIYAVRLYHDENANGKLEKNFAGFPNEPYGVSNNAKNKLSPPEFEKAKFALDSIKTIAIVVE
jgi:uncharacterized protein (DUF2141 family)